MSRKSKCDYLLEKSIQAAISAIEVYNKPDFKYREESFCILMVNSWEVLLKAKILQNNNNSIKCLYIIDKKHTKKDGSAFANSKFKKSRSGNYFTIDILNALKKITIDTRLRENLKLLVEIRDNAIHFYNESKLFEKKVLEIGTASLKSYVDMIKEWFNYDLSKYNFFLMPISFFHPHEMQSFSINQEDKQHQNLLRYINSKEKDFPSDESQRHNISLILETKFIRSKSTEGLAVKFDPANPAAVSVKFDPDERFANVYPWSYKEDLVPNLSIRYNDFKFNTQFYKIKSELETNTKYCETRYLDIKHKKTPKKFYSPNILDVFDIYYTKI